MRSICTEFKSPYIREALEKACLAKGVIRANSYFSEEDIFIYIHHEKFGYCIKGSIRERHDCEHVAIEEFIKEVEGSDKDTFFDGDKEIIIYKNGKITYGCTTISKLVVDEIIARRNKLIS